VKPFIRPSEELLSDEDVDKLKLLIQKYLYDKTAVLFTEMTKRAISKTFRDSQSQKVDISLTKGSGGVLYGVYRYI
jgi:hypothetical protein